MSRSEEQTATGGEQTSSDFDDRAIPEPEPWEPWETRLCLWSVGLGIIGLCILGAIVNVFIL